MDSQEYSYRKPYSTHKQAGFKKLYPLRINIHKCILICHPKLILNANIPGIQQFKDRCESMLILHVSALWVWLHNH